VTAEGDSPVSKNVVGLVNTPSKAGHEKSCLNPGGPSPKTKYYLVTDSAQVPWGNGEKNPVEGSEIDTETVRLQTVRALRSDGVPFA
jgi:hypothetical protein